jgi:hypothetical protein
VGSKRDWRKLHKLELNNLFFLPNKNYRTTETKKGENSGACGAPGKDEKYKRKFERETIKEILCAEVDRINLA